MSKNAKRMPMDEAKAVAAGVVRLLEAEGIRCEVCGSLRRGTKPDVGDLDIVVGALPRAYVVIMACQGLAGTMPKPKKGKPARQAHIDLSAGIRCGLYFAFPEEWGAMVLFLSGNHIFNIKMRANAKRQGLKLNQYGLYEGDNVIAGRDERQIFDALGMLWVEPAGREYPPYMLGGGSPDFFKKEEVYEGNHQVEGAGSSKSSG